MLIAQRLCLVSVLLLVACTSSLKPTQARLNQDSASVEALFTVQADDKRTVVRAIIRATNCPDIQWDNRSPVQMQIRAAAATEALRGDGAQRDSKPAVFDVLTCEALWPTGVQSARVNGAVVAAPRADIRRVVLIADTGCRMKASEDAFQACNDAVKWPFAAVAKSAAAVKPDLIIHIGDIHYRESPCPAGNTGCANSPWGYGYDTWRADLFEPAKPLLAAAPWVFVRGNHESCNRAGQGWFRFIDARAWSSQLSCNNPEADELADYTAPYAVSIASDTQLIVFDSSKAAGKPLSPADKAFVTYATHLRAVEALSKQKPKNFFMSHHPLLAYAPTDDARKIKPGGTASLQSVFSNMYPERLFPAGITTALHGHVHLFESLSFKTAHPASLIVGNSGSANEGFAPQSVPPGSQPYPGALIEDYASRSGYGFAVLDRQTDGAWLLTEHDVQGVPVISCRLADGKSRCAALPTAKQ